MATCKTCGKFGFFLTLDENGDCVSCQAEKGRQQREQNLTVYMEKLKKQEAEEKEKWDAVCSLPRFKILTSPAKIKVQSTTFLSDLPFANITSRSSMEKLGNFVVIDTETTGLSVTKNDIIEIAAIKCENFSPIEIFHTFICPKHGLNDEAMQVNRIDESMVGNAPMLYEVIPSLQEFISGYNLLAHNFTFDFKFLCRGGLDITSEKRKYYDSMQIAQKMLKKPKYKYDEALDGYFPDYDADYDVEDHKLDTLCEYYDIMRFDQHRALGDCYDTARLFHALADDKIG